MKKIAMFCIPAHGHTNPMLPVAAELVKRGNSVRFYSFDEFGGKIAATGAEFVSLSGFLPDLTEKEEQGLKTVKISEMTKQDIRITILLNDFFSKEFASFKPDVVYSDSACFWGKLGAWKFGVPLVVSTSTFAFNQMSSQYMKHSLAEMADLVFSLPKMNAEMKKLEPLGYKTKGFLSMVSSDNDTDSVVYTSKGFQPYAETFSDHYLFMGPSLRTNTAPAKDKPRPLVYISMGTVINDRPDFYKNCIAALGGMNADVVISCGKTVDIAAFGSLPENIRMFPTVDQLDVLSKADVFITHCGMNSVSESLYMAAPMVLYPQTGEQEAVARRVREIGAGEYLKDDSAEGIKVAVTDILGNAAFAKAARDCCDELRACPGVCGAAEFIENAPHSSNAPDPLKALNRESGKYMWVFRIAVVILTVLTWVFLGKGYLWIIGLIVGVFSTPIRNAVSRYAFRKIYPGKTAAGA